MQHFKDKHQDDVEVTSINGEEMVQEMASNMQNMLDKKVKAVKVSVPLLLPVSNMQAGGK